MPSVDNKVHYGLTNVYYAPLTETHRQELSQLHMVLLYVGQEQLA